jgi:hypothetical protein
LRALPNSAGANSAAPALTALSMAERATANCAVGGGTLAQAAISTAKQQVAPANRQVNQRSRMFLRCMSILLLAPGEGCKTRIC